MEFNNYTTIRDARRRSFSKRLVGGDPASFYKQMIWRASRSNDRQLSIQASCELNWEQRRRPYYNVWPSIIPLLTRLNLHLDSSLIQLPKPSLCIRLPKDPTKNPLWFDWQGKHIHVCSILMGDLFQGQGISLHINIGDWTLHPYLAFYYQDRLTVEEHLNNLAEEDDTDESRIRLPNALMADCLRLCCTLCLLDKDPSVISPDVLADDRTKYEATLDEKYVSKAHHRGKVGWDVGRHIEQIPHYRRPHFTIVRTGKGRKIPKIVPRKGCIVHRDVVETIPTGFLEQTSEGTEVASLNAHA